MGCGQGGSGRGAPRSSPGTGNSDIAPTLSVFGRMSGQRGPDDVGGGNGGRALVLGGMATAIVSASDGRAVPHVVR